MSRISAIGSGANMALSYQMIKEAERTEMPSDSAREQEKAVRDTQNDAVRTSDQSDVKASGEDSEKEIESLTGYTENQVQLLYRQGQITRHEMDQELDRREQLQEVREESVGKVPEKEEEDRKVQEEKSEEKKDQMMEQAGIGYEAVAQKNADEVEAKAAGTEDTKAQKADAQKTDAQQNRSGAANGQNAAGKQVIQEQAEEDSAFAERMGGLQQIEQDFTLNTEAAQNAQEHDREEIMQNILNSRVAPGNLGE